MRRWNGWGEETVDYPLPAGATALLEEWIGPATPPADTSFAAVVQTVGPSRLPDHPLVDCDPAGRVLHARGQSLPDWIDLRSGRVNTFPDGVAYPESEEEVQTLLRYAQEVGAVVIPYGGGTSVVGHINPLPDSPPVLTLDMRRLNRLYHLDKTSGLATFGAGVAGPDLEAQLRAHGFTLGHYPQSFEQSTLGGWVATRSTGQQSLGYGRIEAMFAGGRLAAPAGILDLPARFPASAAGPDLRELVLGSEGRLGVLTEVTVRARPLPQRELFDAVFFPEFEAGREAVRQIVQAGLPLSMMRLSTATETETTLALAGHRRLIGALEKVIALRGVGEGKVMLLFGCTGRERLVRAAHKEALALARQWGGVPAGQIFARQWHKGRFRTPYLRNTLWEKGYAVDTLETATDWTNVPAMITAVESALHQALAEQGERVHVFTHLSHVYPAGTSLYTTYLFRLLPDPEQTLTRWQVLKQAASEAIVTAGGTISHQHGVGTDHAPYLPPEKGVLGMAALQALCRQFDPQGMMNPGKLLAGA